METRNWGISSFNNGRLRLQHLRQMDRNLRFSLDEDLYQTHINLEDATELAQRRQDQGRHVKITTEWVVESHSRDTTPFNEPGMVSTAHLAL